MREIKFRFWHKENKVFECDYLDASAYFQNPFKRDDLIPCQFTGLKDKNGKKIYEGDIVQVKEIHWLVEPINSLERDGDNYGLCVSPNGSGENYFMDKSILNGEIIGNIYENPELLTHPTLTGGKG